MPIVSKIKKDGLNTSVICLYIAPLKALITDQNFRLEALVNECDIKITPWHGDVSSSKKRNLFKSPTGILQITPESLESLLINNNYRLNHIFKNLTYIIIDELHVFLIVIEVSN